MRIETTLELKTLGMRRAHKLTMVDLTLAAAIKSDDLEGIAAQWPIVRLWMKGHEQTTGRQSFPMSEARCDGATLCFMDEPVVEATGRPPELEPAAMVRGLRLDVTATEGEYLATLRLVVRFSVHALGDDRATTWGGRIGRPVAIELEVGT